MLGGREGGREGGRRGEQKEEEERVREKVVEGRIRSRRGGKEDRTGGKRENEYSYKYTLPTCTSDGRVHTWLILCVY